VRAKGFGRPKVLPRRMCRVRGWPTAADRRPAREGPLTGPALTLPSGLLAAAPDPGQTSELRSTTAAIQLTADIRKAVNMIAGVVRESARGPPAWDDAPEAMPDWDLLKQREPNCEFDQRVAW
jgi:hypothetical protein